MTKVTVLIGQYWKRESGYSRCESDKTLAGQMNKMLELIYYKTKPLKEWFPPCLIGYYMYAGLKLGKETGLG